MRVSYCFLLYMFKSFSDGLKVSGRLKIYDMA